ncbi:MAG: mismatch-specific DNA-glycosylase [Microthrixaceae bacterium]|nr:mismatch-specific DNA-glycosylase [Microthrixaceae bacterium]
MSDPGPSSRGDGPHRITIEVEPTSLPMELWELHQRLPVGAVVRVDFRPARPTDDTVGDGSPTGAGPTLTHVLFSDVVTGAGFEIVERADSAIAGHAGTGRTPEQDDTTDARRDTSSGQLRLRRTRTLADTVGPRMRLLLVGLNPSLHAADSGVGFSGPSNRGWPALVGAGLAETDRDPLALLRDRGIGMTDLVKRATARADELDRTEYRSGLERLERLCAWLQPAAVCVVGLSGWRAAVDRRARAGEQTRLIGNRPVWLMPNPSGLNTHVSLDDLCGHLRSALSLAERSSST